MNVSVVIQINFVQVLLIAIVPGFHPGHHYHVTSNMGGFKVQGVCVCVCVSMCTGVTGS